MFLVFVIVIKNRKFALQTADINQSNTTIQVSWNKKKEYECIMTYFPHSTHSAKD